MIIAFYICMIVVAVFVLAYAVVTSAPIIAERATDAWDWWRSLPIYELVLVPLGQLTGTRVDRFDDLLALWDPWGAAIGLVFVFLFLWGFMRYVPRLITGSIGGK